MTNANKIKRSGISVYCGDYLYTILRKKFEFDCYPGINVLYERETLYNSRCKWRILEFFLTMESKGCKGTDRVNSNGQPIWTIRCSRLFVGGGGDTEGNTPTGKIFWEIRYNKNGFLWSLDVANLLHDNHSQMKCSASSSSSDTVGDAHKYDIRGIERYESRGIFRMHRQRTGFYE